MNMEYIENDIKKYIAYEINEDVKNYINNILFVCPTPTESKDNFDIITELSLECLLE